MREKEVKVGVEGGRCGQVDADDTRKGGKRCRSSTTLPVIIIPLTLNKHSKRKK